MLSVVVGAGVVDVARSSLQRTDGDWDSAVVIVPSTMNLNNLQWIYTIEAAIHPLTNIHFVHSQSTTLPYILSTSFHEAELLSNLYNNFIQTWTV